MIQNKEGLEKYAKLKNIKRTLINYSKHFSDALYDVSQSISKTFSNENKRTKEEIAEYRKKIKVYDVFNFNNELEVLDIRLHILDKHVDYFVLVESPLTHSGFPKELFYEKNKHLYKKFEHKILHYVVETPIKDFKDAEDRLKNPTTGDFERKLVEQAIFGGHGRESFVRDAYEKEYVRKPLSELGLSDDDFCFISDLDEIWNPDVLIDYCRDDIFKVKQKCYVYYLNNRSNENWRGWTGTIGTKYKNIKSDGSVNHLRTLRMKDYSIIKNGGWHFTYQGGAEKVMKKVESSSHQEINNTTIKSQIQKTMSKNKDIMGRHFTFWVDDKDLPKYLLENKEKYRHLFK
jgi:hypothetical protein